MKPIAFQIKNFRSIEDSGKCRLSPGITVIAGKNESGKSNVLDALKKFELNEKFLNSDYPGYSKKDDTNPITITIEFEIDATEVKNLIKIVGLKINEEKLGQHEGKTILVTKSSDHPDSYKIEGNFINNLKTHLPPFDKKKDTQRRKTEIGKIRKQIEAIYSEHDISRTLNIQDINNTSECESILSKEKSWAKSNLCTYIYSRKQDNATISEVNKHLDNICTLCTPSDPESLMITTLKPSIEQLIPRTVLFDSFMDSFPDQVDIDDLNDEDSDNAKIKIVRDFAKLSKLDISTLANSDESQEQANIVDEVSELYSSEFGSYWHQDKIKIILRYSDRKLSFFVKDVDDNGSRETTLTTNHKLRQRSRGLQWYMAFFIRLNAEGRSKGNLILIDEPGLYLHAKAQQDVLDLLEKLSKENTIVFTTHSPYLINQDKLDRLRLSVKEKSDGKSKSVLLNGFNHSLISAEVNNDTLTPVITAIGLDFSKCIENFKTKNVIVEGVSDYYYLRGMSNYLKLHDIYHFPDDDIGIIPCVGHTKVGLMASLLMGWGLNNFVFLLDKKGTEDTVKKIKDDGIADGRIIFAGRGKNASIEDVFVTEDRKLICKNGKEQKVTVSRKFYENVNSGSIELSKKSCENFQKIFEKIEKNL